MAFRVWGISLVGFQERERESVVVFVRAPGRTSLSVRTLLWCCTTKCFVVFFFVVVKSSFLHRHEQQHIGDWRYREETAANILAEVEGTATWLGEYGVGCIGVHPGGASDRPGQTDSASQGFGISLNHVAEARQQAVDATL